MVLWCDGSLSLLSLWLGKKEMAKSTAVGVTFCCLVISLGIFSWFSSTRLNPSFYCWMRLARFVKSVYESKGGDGGFCSVVWFRFPFGVDNIGPTIGGNATSEITLFAIVGEPSVSSSSCPTSVRIGIERSCKVWIANRTPAVEEGLLLMFLFRVPTIISKTKRWLLNCYGGGICNRKWLRLRGA